MDAGIKEDPTPLFGDDSTGFFRGTIWSAFEITKIPKPNTAPGGSIQEKLPWVPMCACIVDVQHLCQYMIFVVISVKAKV